MDSAQIPKPALQRLASTAGVKRVSGAVYETLRSMMNCELTIVLQNAYVFMSVDKRKILALRDVLGAIEEQGTSFAYSPALKKVTGSSKGSRSNKKKGGGRPHKFKAGTVALREIKKHQKESQKLYIAKARFVRRIRLIASDMTDEVRISADAALALQMYIEKFAIGLLTDANLQAIHASRVTVMESDLYIVDRITSKQC